MLVENKSSSIKKESVTFPLEEFVNFLLPLQNNSPKLTKENSVSSYYRPMETYEEREGVLGYLGFYSQKTLREDNLFLTDDDKSQLITYHDYDGEGFGGFSTPPKINFITSFMERVEKEVVSKLEPLYKEKIKEIIRLAKIALEKTRKNADKNADSWNAEIDRLSKELAEKNDIITKREQEIALLSVQDSVQEKELIQEEKVAEFQMPSSLEE